MIKIPFFRKRKRFVGIDIGTFSTKIVELSYSKNKAVLENYGEKVNPITDKDLYRNLRKRAFFASSQEMAETIKEILKEAKISTKEVFFSIPDFMSFFTVFKTPPMPKEEMASVVQFEARQHIPLSLQEVSLDWSVINEENNEAEEKKGSKVLLVAVPNKVISQYQEISGFAGLEMMGVEAEVFSLARIITEKDNADKALQLIDIGVQSTTITMIKNGTVYNTYSTDFSSSEIVRLLADKFDISYNEAEKVMREEGVKNDVIRKQVDLFASEARQIADSFFKSDKKEVDRTVVAGGSAIIPGLREYFSQSVKREVEIIDSFSNVSFPPVLEGTLKKIGSRYAIATGLALRGLEK